MSVNQASHCSRHLNKAILNQKSPQRFTFWHIYMAHCLVLCDNPSRRVSIRWNRERSNSTSLNSCQSQVWTLHHSDVYSRSFGNTGNLIPSLLQHPSVYLLINQLRALFADQESPAAKFASSMHTILALTITCLTLGGCTIRIFTASKRSKQ